MGKLARSAILTEYGMKLMKYAFANLALKIGMESVSTLLKAIAQ